MVIYLKEGEKGGGERERGGGKRGGGSRVGWNKYIYFSKINTTLLNPIFIPHICINKYLTTND